MREITLRIDTQPKAKQSFKFTKEGRKYTPSDVKMEIGNIKAQIANQLPRDWKLFSEWVVVTSLQFKYAPLKSKSKAWKAAVDKSDKITTFNFINYGKCVFKTTKPDFDNLEKMLFDAMNNLVYIDDALIGAVFNMVKRYSNKPGITITLRGE